MSTFGEDIARVILALEVLGVDKRIAKIEGTALTFVGGGGSKVRRVNGVGPDDFGDITLPAASGIQPGDNISLLTNDAGYLTAAGAVTSITGTANQVIASAAVGSVTLSLPQDIHTGAVPTFAGITVNGTTSGFLSTVTGANATIPGDFIVDTTVATQPALRASNFTNFAHAGPIALFRMRNATDTGPVLSLENAGTGNYITADSVFSVAKSGRTTVNVENILTTTTSGLVLQNPTASTSGVPTQYSPALDFIGHAYRTLAADRTVRFRVENRPVTGAAPTGNLVWMSSVDTGTESWTDRMTLTTAGLLTATNLASSGLTSGRITYATTAGQLTDSANLTFDGNKLSVLSATSNANRIAIGASAGFYQSTATSGSGNTLVNYVLTEGGGNLLISAPTHTSTTANEFGLQVVKTFTPGSASSGRAWGLNFLVTGSGSVNMTDATSAIVGVEGTAVNNSTGVVSAMSAAILFNSHAASSTTTRYAALDAYGPDASGNGTTGATVTEGIAVIARFGRASGAGLITTNAALQGRLATVSGTAAITTQYFTYVSNGTMSAFTANGQTRIAHLVPAIPDPGAFTGTTAFAIDLQGTSRATRDGIRIAADASAIIYSGASGRVDVTGAFEAVNDVRGRQMIADGDNAGVASTNSLTNATDILGEVATSLTQRNGNGSSTHTGYIKMYVGTTAVYVPYFN